MNFGMCVEFFLLELRRNRGQIHRVLFRVLLLVTGFVGWGGPGPEILLICGLSGLPLLLGAWWRGGNRGEYNNENG